jgi:hypothetical protein
MATFAVRPTGEQTMSQREVDALMQEARMSGKPNAPLTLGIRQIRMMREKNAGYPKHMYHETLEPRIAIDEREENALTQAGYTEQYYHKNYPKFLHRRNMDAKFEPNFDRATGLLTNEPFVESRMVRNPEDEKALRAMKPKKGESPWFEAVAELPPLEEAPDEDPAVTIANLRGQIEALERKPGKSKGD